MTRLRKMMLEELRRRNYSSDHARNYLRVVTERTATVEVTSEHKDFPIESSLSIEPGQGWRAAQLGVQTIPLFLDKPLPSQKGCGCTSYRHIENSGRESSWR